MEAALCACSSVPRRDSGRIPTPSTDSRPSRWGTSRRARSPAPSSSRAASHCPFAGPLFRRYGQTGWSPRGGGGGRTARGVTSMTCPAHGVPISPLEPLQAIAAVRDEVQHMDSMADRQRDRQVSETILQGKQAVGQFDVFLCYNREDAAEVE